MEAQSRRHQLVDVLQSIKSLVERIESDDRLVESSMRQEVEALKKERNEAKNKCSLLQQQLDEAEILRQASKRLDANPMLLPPRPLAGKTTSHHPYTISPSGSQRYSQLPLTSDTHLLMHLMANLAGRSSMQETEAMSSRATSLATSTSTSTQASTPYPVSAPAAGSNRKPPVGRLSIDLAFDCPSSLSAPLSPSQSRSRQSITCLISLLIASLVNEHQQQQQQGNIIGDKGWEAHLAAARGSVSDGLLLSPESSSSQPQWGSSARQVQGHTNGNKNLASISLEDDKGSYGVGVAAAAAVSALNARAWASKAESSQSNLKQRRSITGQSAPDATEEASRVPTKTKAGFRLVASINGVGSSSPLKPSPVDESRNVSQEGLNALVEDQEEDLLALIESRVEDNQMLEKADSHFTEQADSHSIEPTSATRDFDEGRGSFSFPETPDVFEDVDRVSGSSERRGEVEVDRSPFSRLSHVSRASTISPRNSMNSRSNMSSRPAILQKLGSFKGSSKSEIRFEPSLLTSPSSHHHDHRAGSAVIPSLMRTSSSIVKRSTSFRILKITQISSSPGPAPSPAPVPAPTLAPTVHAPGLVSQSSLRSVSSVLPPIEPLVDANGDPICRWQTSISSAVESGNVEESILGTTLTLEWITPPRTALVVCKLAPHVWPGFLSVLKWLRRHGIAAWIEPVMWKVALEAGATLPLNCEEKMEASGVLSAHYDGGLPVRTWAMAAEDDFSIPDSIVENLDFAVVLGGDGTLLWTCHVFGNQAVPPVLPFNLGSLGFLTPFEPSEIDRRLGQVVEGGFPMILRHRLHCVIMRASPSDHDGGAGSNEKVVLNEVVVDRGTAPYLANIEAFCDGNFVTRVQGDGLIISTPTGSTAYNLAAGGSMLHPQVPGILFTPICPHSLSFRPLIFPDHVQLCIQVPADGRSQLWCSFDGKDRQPLGPGDAIIIRMSEWPIPTVSSLDPSRDWFMGVRQGLHWNERRPQAGAGK